LIQNKLSKYSYFILRRDSEKFLLQAMLQTLIKDFKSKSKHFDKINEELKLKPKPKAHKMKDKKKVDNSETAVDFVGSSTLYTENERKMIDKLEEINEKQNAPKVPFNLKDKSQEETTIETIKTSQPTEEEERDKYMRWLLLSQHINNKYKKNVSDDESDSDKSKELI